MPLSVERLFTPANVEKTELGDGAFVFRSGIELGSYPDTLCEHLDHWAEKTPDKVFLAERTPDRTWATLSYSEAKQKAWSIAGALLERGLSADDPVMILSDNSIDHGLLMLGCYYAGVPVAPVSPAYSLMSQDFAKLRHIHELLRPKLIFAANGAQFQRAFDALPLTDEQIVVSANPMDNRHCSLFAELAEAAPSPLTEKAFEAIGPDKVAKILFTSGSTGTPKGVINTHRMMCSNQQAISRMWPFLAEVPPVIVDWLPWNHTFGGNHNFNLILRNGGSLYIDDGKPAPGLVERTIENLREVAPTIYFNVPRGFDMVLPALEQDGAFRDHFFSRLDLIFYAAAALPQTTWERLENQAVAACGRKVVMTSAWGATETAPLATSAHLPLDRAGIVGVPAPGTEIKFVPNGDKQEMRIRGPNVTPGYFKRDDLTREAFDDDGFYVIGDAGLLANDADPSQGIVFDGRVAEDFKLLTGTWVSVGSVRVQALAAASPAIQDAVVTGHDRDEIGLLIFPNPAACAAIAGLDASTPLAEIVKSSAVLDHVSNGLHKLNEQSTGSKSRVCRFLLMTEPPNVDANEITDKGYINQRAVLARRADLVERLYSTSPDDDVTLL